MGRADRRRQENERRAALKAERDAADSARRMARHALLRRGLAISALVLSTAVLLASITAAAVPRITKFADRDGAVSVQFQPKNPSKYADLYGGALPVTIEEDKSRESAFTRHPILVIQETFAEPAVEDMEKGDYDWTLRLSKSVIGYRTVDLSKAHTRKPGQFVLPYTKWLRPRTSDASLTVPAAVLQEPQRNRTAVDVQVQVELGAPVVSEQQDGAGVWTQTWEIDYQEPSTPVSWHEVETDGATKWPWVDPTTLPVAVEPGSKTLSPGDLTFVFCPECQILHGHSRLDELRPGEWGKVVPVMQASRIIADTTWRPYSWTDPPIMYVTGLALVASLTACGALIRRRFSASVWKPFWARLNGPK